MAQVHFIEARDETGGWRLVRADSIDWIEPFDLGLVLHTPSGPVQAFGATRATLHQDMQSAQIVMVNLNRSIAAAPVTVVHAPEPARQAVVRAPPPVLVPGVNTPEPGAEIAATPEASQGLSIANDPTPKTRRKVGA